MSLFSFADLFNKEIELIHHSGETERGVIREIVIPKIQRPYAQGRLDFTSSRVRRSFLKDIFDAIISGQELELNYIYGNIVKVKVNNTYEYRMELLDGQQRLTTLFLLYWYLYARELSADNIPPHIIKCLKSFKYETRASSGIFCKRLSCFFPDELKTTTPSKLIKGSAWYRKGFDYDTTVSGMICMLDAIHEHYTEYLKSHCDPLHIRLELLRFYFASIGEFSHKDDLYIKMNARGLQLSAFESLKADLAKYVQDDSKEHSDFISNLDTHWIDIFWRADQNEKFDEVYLKTISRICATLHMITTTGMVRDDAYIRHLFTDMNAETAGKVYWGFEYYQKFFGNNMQLLSSILDAFFEKDIRKIIVSDLLPSWKRVPVADFESTFNSFLGGKINTQEFPVFAAIVLYIKGLVTHGFNDSTFFEQSFHRWMRVTHNLIENTDISNVDNLATLVRRLDSISKQLDYTQPEIFYKSLSQVKIDSDRFIKDELEKAAAIAMDQSWEPILNEAEAHPFFKGDVHFIFSHATTPDVFHRRYINAANLFDEKGIAPAYRMNHVLIRAIVSDYRSWKELLEYYITENADAPKNLKKNLRKPQTCKMFAHVLDVDSPSKLLDELNKHIVADKSQCDATDYPFKVEEFEIAVEALRSNSLIYDLIQERETDSKFRVYSYYGNGFALSRYNSPQRIYLDTDRCRIALEIEANSDLGFIFEDSEQRYHAQKCHFCFSDKLQMISNPDASYQLLLVFDMKHEVHLHVYDMAIKSQLMSLLPNYAWYEIPDANRFGCKLNSRHGKFDSTCPSILKELREVLDAINNRL